MVLPAKSAAADRWGMGGFLLIFFPEDSSDSSSSSKKKTLLSLTSPNSFQSPSSAARRSASARLILKTHSTLSICALLLFTAFLLFTLSTFDPSPIRRRRILLSNAPPPSSAVKALQGMGRLYRRGPRAMSDLLVAHVSDAVHPTQLRTFLRIILTNGLLARSDLVFIFSSSSVSSKLSPLIPQENNSFLKLVLSLDEFNRTSHASHGRVQPEEDKESKEAIWGKGFRDTNDSIPYLYGSVVGFDASELDPENTLSGFLDQVPMGLRRWACYPMLLGRLRRSYTHIALLDVNTLLLVNDPFTRVRNRSPESVFLWSISHSNKNGKRQSPTINPGIVVGGSRGVRRLSDAVLTQIVRAVIEHKGNKSVTEPGIMNQLLHGGHLLRNVNVIAPAEPVPDVGEVFGSDPVSRSVSYSGTVVQWQYTSTSKNRAGNLRGLWCGSDLHSVVYRDCLAPQSYI